MLFDNYEKQTKPTIQDYIKIKPEWCAWVAIEFNESAVDLNGLSNIIFEKLPLTVIS
jgi:hypothetical protein